MVKPRRVALVHDWLNGMRGGEKVLEIITEIFPESEIFTLLLEEEKISDKLLSHRIHTSFVQTLPFRRTRYRNYLPLFPRAIQRFDLSDFDLVISTSHCVAKGAIPAPGALHVCYCFSPMRYVWRFYDQYFGRNPLKKLFLKPTLRRIRRWDYKSCSRVHRFVAISKNVADRIGEFYGREADVIYPPVNTKFFSPGRNRKRGDYFLIVSALVPYKRIDLAIDAFNELALPLRIIGRGPQLEKLRRTSDQNITFHGWLSDEEVRENYRNCRALVFPGEEDFGLTPIEANACGAPVIAYGRGGVAESVVEGKTGMFFEQQTVDSLISAVKQFEKMDFDPKTCRKHSLQFDTEVFRKKFSEYVLSKYAEFAATSSRA
jgi:glycosyltransferase involved in cell wall biosynthesis